ncbi:hypothetical protein EDC01DRAFT_651540 [Geopyxis carbonaria]|nr:hypothetical protein EDC01DRAFT_651540 [Geopyxis carbonaria]
MAKGLQSHQPKSDEDEIMVQLSTLRTSVRSHVLQYYDFKRADTTFSTETLNIKPIDKAAFTTVLQYYISSYLFHVIQTRRGNVTPVNINANSILPNLHRYAKEQELDQKATRIDNLGDLIKIAEAIGGALSDPNYSELRFGDIGPTKTPRMDIIVFPDLKRGDTVLRQQDTETVNGKWKLRSKYKRVLEGIREPKRKHRDEPGPPAPKESEKTEPFSWLSFLFFLDIAIFMLSHLRKILYSHCKLKEDCKDLGLLEESEIRDLSIAMMDSLDGHFEKRMSHESEDKLSSSTTPEIKRPGSPVTSRAFSFQSISRPNTRNDSQRYR